MGTFFSLFSGLFQRLKLFSEDKEGKKITFCLSECSITKVYVRKAQFSKEKINAQNEKEDEEIENGLLMSKRVKDVETAFELPVKLWTECRKVYEERQAEKVKSERILRYRLSEINKSGRSLCLKAKTKLFEELNANSDDYNGRYLYPTGLTTAVNNDQTEDEPYYEPIEEGKFSMFKNLRETLLMDLRRDMGKLLRPKDQMQKDSSLSRSNVNVSVRPGLALGIITLQSNLHGNSINEAANGKEIDGVSDNFETGIPDVQQGKMAMDTYIN